MYEFALERAAKNAARIDHLVDRTGLVKRVIPALGKRLLLLDLPSAVPLSQQTAESYIAQQLVAEQRGVWNNCFDIATAARDAGAFTGTMHADRGTEELLLWGNHCINFDLLEDNTAVAVDLTASHNLDLPQEKYDVLALRAADSPELCLRVGELFGGQWQIDN